MSDAILREEFLKLSVQVQALRDVVARLLAYEVARSPNPAKVCADFSDSADSRIHEMTKRGEPTLPVLAIQELFRDEVDWIVDAARTMAAGGGDTTPDR